MPLASRAVRTRSAVRSVWIWSALSVSTPSTRWMPPWRSRPRLIRFLGGYRYHSETPTTRTTRPTRSQRFLTILLALALALHHARDGGAVERHADLIRDAQHDRLLVDRGD